MPELPSDILQRMHQTCEPVALIENDCLKENLTDLDLTPTESFCNDLVLTWVDDLVWLTGHLMESHWRPKCTNYESLPLSEKVKFIKTGPEMTKLSPGEQEHLLLMLVIFHPNQEIHEVCSSSKQGEKTQIFQRTWNQLNRMFCLLSRNQSLSKSIHKRLSYHKKKKTGFSQYRFGDCHFDALDWLWFNLNGWFQRKAVVPRSSWHVMGHTSFGYPQRLNSAEWHKKNDVCLRKWKRETGWLHHSGSCTMYTMKHFLRLRVSWFNIWMY